MGRHPSESGCVARGPTGDIIGPAACPPGFTGGDEKTGASQTLTRTIAELGLTTAEDLRIVLNTNENVANSISLTNLALTIYSPTGAVLFTTGPFTTPIFPITGNTTATSGYVFELDAAQAAQAQLVFDPGNRVGIAANLINTTAGDERFFVADVLLIGEPLFGADIATTKTAPASVIAGGMFSYSITVTNAGPDPATNVTMTETPGPNQQVISILPPAGWICSGLSCTKPTMAVGESAVFSITVRVCPEVACGTMVTNTATGSSATIDPVTGNNSATVSPLVQAQADVAITKATSTPTVAPGGTVNYTLNVTNNGPSNSTGTTVIDTLPAGFTFVSATTTTGTCSGSGATVTCSLGQIGTAAQCAPVAPTAAMIVITATASATPGTVINTASVSTANCLPDPNAANNTATVPTTITSAAPPPPPPAGAPVGVPAMSPLVLVIFGLALLIAGAFALKIS